jgi:hypothetical protein
MEEEVYNENPVFYPGIMRSLSKNKKIFTK